MSGATYCAAWIDAETGGNETYVFEAKTNLFDMPVSDIIDIFIRHLDSEGGYPSPMSYELDSAVHKKDKKIVLATGSLILAMGEIHFLLMISPQIRGQSS
jgi:hypothetical protein